MTGLKFTVPGADFSGGPLGKLRDDPVLPDAGVLGLWDFSHPLSPVVGNAVSGQAFAPNLALAQARALIGAPADTQELKLYFTKGSAFDGVGNIVERTSKGGLHLIAKRTGVTANGSNLAYLSLSTPGAGVVNTFVLANPTHDWYVSAWGRVTRPVGATYELGAPVVSSFDQGTYSLTRFFMRPGSYGDNVNYPLDSRRIGWRAEGLHGQTAPRARFQNIAVSSTTGGITDTRVHQAGANPLDPSHVLYRFYIEDLTVSGRTYAQVDALDYAEYTKQVLTAGGRYHDDTWSDPATVAA